ncbi:MAG: Cro/Cl family transcriptional regulator [Ignavibacteriae bacterium HGW-Ignavibacteriae-1]|jgi:uncharacterized protein YjbI with pentapeptide repeats|nr:MAG: Cro/Cl family transcriptional regulator [Ignavibacteriae bacterium HGW-Ignavibacteriae-1]
MLNSKTIGNKIAEARKKNNFSQAQLAQLLFISPQAVGKWERGESMPDITTFNSLAEILGVDLNYFSDNFQSNDDDREAKMIDAKVTGEQTIQDDADLKDSNERQILANFSGSNLEKSDFAGVTFKKGKFEGSALSGSDFSGADLIGSSFEASDLHEAYFAGANLTGSIFKASNLRNTNFDNANLTDCDFSALDLTEASFDKSILVRTNFNACGLEDAKFVNSKLKDVKITATDLRKSTFENCIFDGVDFKKSDLRWMSLDGQTFIGVKFDNTALNDVSFKGATLKNVSFTSPYALTNKYFRALKTICFDGAKMDKLTYAVLKGYDVDLSGVTLI